MDFGTVLYSAAPFLVGIIRKVSDHHTNKRGTEQAAPPTIKENKTELSLITNNRYTKISALCFTYQKKCIFAVSFSHIAEKL